LKLLAQNIAATLCEADAGHAADYRQGLAELLGRLDALHERVARMLAPYRGRAFYVFHPGFGYFADAYGLKESAVEMGGRPPAAKELRVLIQSARADGVTTIFVQPQYDPHSAGVMAEAIGGKTVPINGLDKDVIADIGDIAVKVETAMKESSPPRPGNHSGNDK